MPMNEQFQVLSSILMHCFYEALVIIKQFPAIPYSSMNDRHLFIVSHQFKTIPFLGQKGGVTLKATIPGPFFYINIIS